MAIKAEELTKIKDRGARALTKGNYEKALEAFQELAQLQPKDMRLKMKIGDILGKMKRKDEALKQYEEVAEEYSKEGFLIQAVSVYKLILQLDPKRPGMAAKLQELNESRSKPLLPGLRRPGLKPAAAAAAAAPAEAEEAEVELTEEVQEEAARPRLQFPETPLFSALGSEEFAKVVAKFQVGQIPKGTVVIKEGTRGDAFFVLGSGEVRVYRTLPSGRKVTLARLPEGAFFGEMAFFTNAVRTASVETTVDTTLLRINRKALGALMDQYPNVQEVIRNFFKQRALDTLLKTVPLFASLEPEERQALIPKFEMEEVEPGALIVEEGSAPDYLYLIFQGEVEVSTLHEEKGPIKLATLKNSDYFGEISIIQNRPHTADVTASKKTFLFKLSRKVFSELIQIHSAMLEEISRTVDDRLKNTLDSILEK